MKIHKITALHQIKLAITILLLIPVLQGCKKDEETEQDPLTLLTSRSWMRAVNDLNPGSNPSSPYSYDPATSCVLDDIFSYTKDGKYNFQGGPDKCDPSDQLQYSTSYIANFQTNTITQFGYELKILELTSTRLKIAEVLPPNSGGYRIYLFQH